MFGWITRYFERNAAKELRRMEYESEVRRSNHYNEVDLQRQRVYGHDPRLLRAARTLPVIPVCRITDVHGIEIGLDIESGLHDQLMSDERFVYQKATIMDWQDAESAARQPRVYYPPEEVKKFFDDAAAKHVAENTLPIPPDPNAAEKLLAALERSPAGCRPLKPTPPATMWKKESDGG